MKPSNKNNGEWWGGEQGDFGEDKSEGKSHPALVRDKEVGKERDVLVAQFSAMSLCL